MAFIIPHNLHALQQIHFPTTGILRRRSASKADAANVIAAVVKMASGVERCGINCVDNTILPRLDYCFSFIFCKALICINLLAAVEALNWLVVCNSLGAIAASGVASQPF